METFAAAILGTIQGLTEFLPISSSAHLILVPWLFGWKPEGLFFDVSLHFGTALAVLSYFWNDWVVLAREVFRGIAQGDLLGNPQRRLAWYLVVGTLPAMIVGLAFEKYITEHFRSPLITVVTLIVFGALLYFAERAGRHTRSIDQLGWGDSIWIGVSQAVALIPGVSRSGITMTTAMLRDNDRTTSARFSFLLSTPVIVGAAVLEGWHFLKALRLSPDSTDALTHQWSVLFVGTLFATVTGFLSIRYFLRYIQKNSFLPFVVYRFLLAVVVLVFYFRYS